MCEQLAAPLLPGLFILAGAKQANIPQYPVDQGENENCPSGSVLVKVVAFEPNHVVLLSRRVCSLTPDTLVALPTFTPLHARSLSPSPSSRLPILVGFEVLPRERETDAVGNRGSFLHPAGNAAGATPQRSRCHE